MYRYSPKPAVVDILKAQYEADLHKDRTEAWKAFSNWYWGPGRTNPVDRAVQYSILMHHYTVAKPVFSPHRLEMVQVNQMFPVPVSFFDETILHLKECPVWHPMPT